MSVDREQVRKYADLVLTRPDWRDVSAYSAQRLANCCLELLAELEQTEAELEAAESELNELGQAAKHHYDRAEKAEREQIQVGLQQDAEEIARLKAELKQAERTIHRLETELATRKSWWPEQTDPE